MGTYALIIQPYKGLPLKISLSEDDGRQDTIERVVEASATGNFVFSDLTYKFTLVCEDKHFIQGAQVYINDTYQPSSYNEGEIAFWEKGTESRIFLDCYGFVKIGLKLFYYDGSERSLSSEYLSVLVEKGQLNESVEAMVMYVYNHQESLLLNGESKPRNNATLKENGFRNLTAQIALAEEIARVYENNYGFFKANSRFRTERAEKIDCIERLQYVTPATLRYVTSHPDQLRNVYSNTGIRIGSQTYEPRKILTLHDVCSFDIYENRIVVGFLSKILDDIYDMREHCKSLLQNSPKGKDHASGYVYSSYFMFSEAIQTLKKKEQQLSRLYEKFSQLWHMYRDALMISPEPLLHEPKPTAVFMSIAQYNIIFVRIYQWFKYGIYSFESEKYMLSFVKISSLYESYLLAKMLEYFKNRDYVLQSATKCVYPVHRSWKYRNTQCNNTFIFQSKKKRITLYYQPVIFDTDRHDINGIGLYRNNSIPADGDTTKEGARYYTPDFLIKFDEEDTSKYLIIDAKFSKFGNVRVPIVKNLAFKYLFSLSPIKNNHMIAGMGIIYGKCWKGEQVQSAYDKQIEGNEVFPFTDIVPLIEGIDSEDHFNKLDLLFKKLER